MWSFSFGGAAARVYSSMARMLRSTWKRGRTFASCAMRASSFSPCSTAEIERCSLFRIEMASFMRFAFVDRCPVDDRARRALQQLLHHDVVALVGRHLARAARSMGSSAVRTTRSKNASARFSPASAISARGAASSAGTRAARRGLGGGGVEPAVFAVGNRRQRQAGGSLAQLLEMLALHPGEGGEALRPRRRCRGRTRARQFDSATASRSIAMDGRRA